MPSHTPEPWTADNSDTRARGAIVGAFGFGPGAPINAANAARIVACVNACEGIDDPEAALAEVRAALRTIFEISGGQPYLEEVAAKALALLGK